MQHFTCCTTCTQTQWSLDAGCHLKYDTHRHKWANISDVTAKCGPAGICVLAVPVFAYHLVFDIYFIFTPYSYFHFKLRAHRPVVAGVLALMIIGVCLCVCFNANKHVFLFANLWVCWCQPNCLLKYAGFLRGAVGGPTFRSRFF